MLLSLTATRGRVFSLPKSVVYFKKKKSNKNMDTFLRLQNHLSFPILEPPRARQTPLSNSSVRGSLTCFYCPSTAAALLSSFTNSHSGSEQLKNLIFLKKKIMESCYLRPKLSLGKFRLGLNQACLQKFILKLFESTLCFM